MTREQTQTYEDTDRLRDSLKQLNARKYRLDCGHVTFGHPLGNDITTYNGNRIKVICSQCGY